jgi:hypothetical protein
MLAESPREHQQQETPGNTNGKRLPALQTPPLQDSISCQLAQEIPCSDAQHCFSIIHLTLTNMESTARRQHKPHTRYPPSLPAHVSEYTPPLFPHHVRVHTTLPRSLHMCAYPGPVGLRLICQGQNQRETVQMHVSCMDSTAGSNKSKPLRESCTAACNTY